MSLNIDPMNPFYIYENKDQDGGRTISKKMPEEMIEIHDGIAVLKQIPDTTYGITVIDGRGNPFTDRTSTSIPPSQLRPNEFLVLDRVGFLVFNPVQNNKTITVKEYYGKGYWLIDASRIMTELIEHETDGTVDFKTLDNLYDALVEQGDYAKEQGDYAKQQGDMLKNEINKKANKETENGGFAAGNIAAAKTGGAIGRKAKAESGGAAGHEAVSDSGGAVGYGAKTTSGGALGSGAVSGSGFAGGINAKAAIQNSSTGAFSGIDAIQLGTGTNTAAKTLQVYNKRIVESNGSLTDVGALSSLATSQKGTIIGAVNELHVKSHTHSNKAALDGITSDMMKSLNLQNKVYPIDISKVGSGNNILYITIAGITSYDQLNNQVIRLHTGAYSNTNTTPANIYLNVNGLGSKAIMRSITSLQAGYDTKQYYTDLFHAREINRNTVMELSITGSSVTWLNPTSPIRATSEQLLAGTEEAAYITPKLAKSALAYQQTPSGGFVGGSNARLHQYGGGAAVGKDSYSEYGGGAIGENASANCGGAAGAGAEAQYGGAVGMGARADSGGSIGEGATSIDGGAVGFSTKTGNGFAGGLDAQTVDSNNMGIDAIQLGSGTNNAPKTMQVYSKRIVESNGSLTDVGALSNLKTSNKTNIVSALNTLQDTKADKSTTLQGYGITDAYTKDDINNKLSSVYRVRGSIPTINDLPEYEDVEVGDVFNIEKAGTFEWNIRTDVGPGLNGSISQGIMLIAGQPVINGKLIVGGQYICDVGGKRVIVEVIEITPTQAKADYIADTSFTALTSEDFSKNFTMIHTFIKTVPVNPGDNVVFTADGNEPWDVLAGIVDLSDYAQKSDLNQKANRRTVSGGFAAGQGSTATAGAAIGENAYASDGGAAGSNSYAQHGGAAGDHTDTNDGGAVGQNSHSSNGGAIGANTITSNGFAGGQNARTETLADGAIDAVQLGEGTNSKPYTAQIYNYQLLESENTASASSKKWLKDIGNLSTLTTTQKNTIVAALNELNFKTETEVVSNPSNALTDGTYYYDDPNTNARSLLIVFNTGMEANINGQPMEYYKQLMITLNPEYPNDTLIKIRDLFKDESNFDTDFWVTYRIHDHQNQSVLDMVTNATISAWNNKAEKSELVGKKGTGANSEKFNDVNNQASAEYTHAEGNNTSADGKSAHAEGRATHAGGEASHTEGGFTLAQGQAAHAEGNSARAIGNNTHAEGLYTIANGDSSHAQGKFNIEDTESVYAHIVGNGTAPDARSNAHTLDWAGNAWFAGKVEPEDYSNFDAHFQSNFDLKADSQTETGGFAAGDRALVGNQGSGGAIGRDAYAVFGGAVGTGAGSDDGGAIGTDCSSYNGGAAGAVAHATDGGAVGFFAKNSDGFSGGLRAVCEDSSGTAIDAVQLGEGTNRTPKTMQVYSYRLMDANGKIPAERLPYVSGTAVIENSLTSTSTAAALSANQGKLLNESKVDKIAGKGLSANDYTTAEKTKLSGIATNANNYVHPASHAAGMIAQDSTHRFVSDTEKSTWNGKLAASNIKAGDNVSISTSGNNITISSYSNKAYKTACCVVGHTNGGATEDDCDFLCNGENDTQMLQYALKQCCTDGGKLIILQGTYSITKSLTVSPIIQFGKVIIQGNGAIFSYSSSAGFTMLSVSSEDVDVTIENITFQTDDNNISTGKAIEIVAHNTTVQNCTFKRIGTCISMPDNSPGNYRNIISNNMFTKVGHAIDGYTFYTTISNNIFNDFYSAITLTGNNNIISSNQLVSPSRCENGMNVSSANYTLIIGNQINVTMGTACKVKGYAVISGNYIYASGPDGVYSIDTGSSTSGSIISNGNILSGSVHDSVNALISTGNITL